MSSLPDPIRGVLDAEPSEGEVASVWRGIRARRSRGQAGRPVVWAVAFAGMVLAMVVLVAVGPWTGANTPAPSVAGGPLVRVQAQVQAGTAAVPPVLSGGVEITSVAELSDGSRIVPHRKTRLAVLENTGSRFVTLLGDGRVDFAVTPGGPRRWVVECGLATVEVVGTAFELERGAGSLRVHVQHGVVLVRGEHVPDRVRRLSAGESLEILDPKVNPVKVPEGELLPPAVEATPPAASAERGAVDSPAAHAADPASALYAEADRARQAGRAAEAVRLLEEGLTREPAGHRAALRAFTLGRLYLDELGQAGLGARAFERALSAGAPASLEEDVRARLVEARARTGDAAGARRAADEYRSRFPAGRRRAEVDRVSPVE